MEAFLCINMVMIYIHHSNPSRKGLSLSLFCNRGSRLEELPGLPKVTQLLSGEHSPQRPGTRCPLSPHSRPLALPREDCVLVQMWPILVLKCLQLHVSVLQLTGETTLCWSCGPCNYHRAMGTLASEGLSSFPPASIPQGLDNGWK